MLAESIQNSLAFIFSVSLKCFPQQREKISTKGCRGIFLRSTRKIVTIKIKNIIIGKNCRNLGISQKKKRDFHYLLFTDLNLVL